jgi:two-component system heavy metal sensor histidine kinase CusS
MSFADRSSPLNSLSGRFTLVAMVFAASLALVLLGILALGAWRMLIWQEEQVLLQRAEALYSWVSTDVIDEDNLLHETMENVFAPREILMRVVDRRLSEPFETQGFSEALPDLVTTVPGTKPIDAEASLVTGTDGALYLVLLTVRRIGDGANARLVEVRGASNMTLDERAFAGYLRWAVAVTFLLMIGAAFVQFLASRWLLRPVQRITQETALVDPDTFDQRIRADDLPRELAVLADAHNLMLDRLQTAFRGLASYADNAAHELRGPVGRVMVQAELALDTDDLDPGLRDKLDSLYATANSLGETLNTVLFLARADQGMVSPNRHRVRLQDMLDKLSELYRPAAEDAGIALFIECPDDLHWSLDDRLFMQALSNLVENAIRHCRTDDRITLTAKVQDGRLHLSVIDSGEGIASEDLPHVFDRFFRADKVRGTSSGTGLGLAIVRSMAALHGGTVQIDSALGMGTEVTLILP